MLRIAGFASAIFAAVALVSCAQESSRSFPFYASATQQSSERSDSAGSDSTGTANLLKDPSFEQPVVGQGSYQVFDVGQSFSGWTVVGASGDVAIISGTFQQNGFTLDAKSGKQFLDLTGVSQTATGVSQTVSTTANAKYLLTFSVGNVYDPGGIFGTTSTVNVLVNNVQVFTATNSNHSKKAKTRQVWQKFSTTITASSSSTSIAFINADPSNDTINGLDSVKLTAMGASQLP